MKKNKNLLQNVDITQWKDAYDIYILPENNTLTYTNLNLSFCLFSRALAALLIYAAKNI